MFVDLLQRWVAWVSRYAWLTLSSITALTLLLGVVAVSEFRINSDLSKLIDQSSSWRQDFDAFADDFPQLVGTAVVVVQGPSIKRVEQTTAQVLTYLRDRPETFSAVAAPGAESFFRDHAFLYMDIDALDDMADRLAQAQPWLTAVAQDPSLRGILALVSEGLEQNPPPDFARVLELLSVSAQRAVAGQDPTIWWSDELFANQKRQYRVIFLKAQSSFGATLPSAEVVATLRRMVQEINLPADVEINLSGELMLQHEEMEAAVGGVALAGWLALALLFIVLVVGVRSGKIIAAIFVMLAVGVVWTTAFAMLSVGEFNTLSIVFIVMFFGLGVDFALHFSLRFQESVNQGDLNVAHALEVSARSVGRAISLCSLTTAIGFLGFVPTDYKGLGDLGIISAGGMAIAWFLTFTFLPAFYQVVGSPRAHQMDLPTTEKVVNWLIGHRQVVVVVVLIGTVIAVLGVSRVTFDYSVLALKDPHSESMRTLRMMQREGLSTDYQLVAVTAQPLDKEALLALASVSEVQVPQELVPNDQIDKLYVVEDLQQLLWSALYPQSTAQSAHPEALRARLQMLLNRLETLLVQGATSSSIPIATLEAFRDQVMAVLGAEDAVLRNWQRGVLVDLVEELEWLRRATAVEEIGFSDLPNTVRERLITASGDELNVILPAEDIAEVDALSHFIESVRARVPQATGRPVIEWGVGRIVVNAFQEALLFALIGIALVLVLALKKLRSVVLILVPLVLTAMLTLALGVIFDRPINMANILVLPLIFGLGVDNGIHVVDRYIGEGDVSHLLHSSTPRAVLLSTLTTIGAFSALSLSPHAGTASIGLLLTVAIGLLLIFTVFLLPVLLAVKKADP